jgi:F420-dependent oxidoreductase-like protein
MTMLKDRRLQVGVHAPPEGRDFETMKTLCQTAESLGYDLFTMTDHFMNMANPSGRENHPLECWTTLGALAAVTSRIFLGPLVSCVNYRHPTVLGKIATTLDIISNGRLLFGIGAGWHEMEYAGFMGRFPSAKERLDGLEDAVQICRSMFTNEFTDYAGNLYSAKGTLNSPSPVQKPIPIMIGGAGERRTLKIAAKYADIAHIIANSTRELEHKLEVLRKHCSNVSRDFSSIRIGSGLRPLLDPSKEDVKAQVEWVATRIRIPAAEAEKIVQKTVGPKNILATIGEYQHLNVTLITFNMRRIEEVKSLKDQVISKLNR